MDSQELKASCTKARQMDMVSYLSALGYTPSKITHADYWYLSPLRSEKTPSFKINRRLNRWYDHGLGRGGNLIDFAILYKDCTVGEFLKSLQTNTHPTQSVYKASHKTPTERVSPIQIIRVGPIVSFSLQRYLHQRRISLGVAERFCKEVHYTLWGKTCFALGFPNCSGGYELRNAHFKGSTRPKDVTLIEQNAPALAVFEGFFDFLSFMTLAQHQPFTRSNYLVLNSVALFEKARPLMERHKAIDLYLDRDAAGQNCTRHAVSLSPQYRDQSHLYTHYKDVNDWMMHVGKSLQPTQDATSPKPAIKIKY